MGEGGGGDHEEVGDEVVVREKVIDSRPGLIGGNDIGFRYPPPARGW